MFGTIPSIVRWSARLAALLVVGAFVFLLAGEIFNPHSGSPTRFREWAGIGLLLAVIVGMLMAWRWELLGALLSLVALAAFIPVVRMHQYEPIIVIAVPGVLFLSDWALRRSHGI
jgi:hypothetical protein